MNRRRDGPGDYRGTAFFNEAIFIQAIGRHWRRSQPMSLSTLVEVTCGVFFFFLNEVLFIVGSSIHCCITFLVLRSFMTKLSAGRKQVRWS